MDPAGQTVFGSAKPQMWDAGGENPQAGARPAAPGAKFLRTAPGGFGPATAAPKAITNGTKQADLGVTLEGEKLTLTPDRQLLDAAGTTYPVVIDPTWDAWKQAWTIAYKHNAFPSSAGTNYWNGGTLSKDARVGCAKDAQNGNAVICAKTFFQVGMKDYWDKQILESTLRIKQKSAGSWSCRSGDIHVWDTGTISKSTTWNNQPDWQRLVDATGQSYGGRNCPGDGALYGYTAGGVAMFTFPAQANGGFAAPVKSWTRTKEQWDYARTKFTVGDYDGDGRADAALMYDHGDGHGALYTLLAEPDGTVGDAVRSWDTPEEYWYASNTSMPVSGDADGDGRADVLSMYNYHSGATGAFTFKSRPDGGFENGFLSWQTLPGTW
ncbi:FG-GAP repeat domain-containing protein [Streptomyces bambusae]|uniref:VCBS repeat-containing protein n=1 Tax=Streptomyces bambusae TaxID=1550616 RepID=A0ABS6Z4S2_9ACTN|nr:VCBS repeat-containing protein [Streptomyces bambusae]MBW5482771.1 hypothetical protein [Streptomyces bambusae]